MQINHIDGFVQKHCNNGIYKFCSTGISLNQLARFASTRFFFHPFRKTKCAMAKKSNRRKIRYVWGQLKDYSQPRTHLRNKSLLNWLSQVLYDTYIISDAMKFMTLIVGGKSRWTYFIYIRGDHLPFFSSFRPFLAGQFETKCAFCLFYMKSISAEPTAQKLYLHCFWNATDEYLKSLKRYRAYVQPTLGSTLTVSAQ